MKSRSLVAVVAVLSYFSAECFADEEFNARYEPALQRIENPNVRTLIDCSLKTPESALDNFYSNVVWSEHESQWHGAFLGALRDSEKRDWIDATKNIEIAEHAENPGSGLYDGKKKQMADIYFIHALISKAAGRYDESIHYVQLLMEVANAQPTSWLLNSFCFQFPTFTRKPDFNPKLGTPAVQEFIAKSFSDPDSALTDFASQIRNAPRESTWQRAFSKALENAKIHNWEESLRMISDAENAPNRLPEHGLYSERRLADIYFVHALIAKGAGREQESLHYRQLLEHVMVSTPDIWSVGSRYFAHLM